tara:strand:+ start:678 stop:3884 length:3207 start_codon:yes stop_codon:yes gene_type:complete
MPRLSKFKDIHISPLTGPMNSATPLDLLPNKQFRYVKNFRVDGAGRLRRGAGFKPLFDDGNYGVCSDTSKTTQAACLAASGTWSILNNSDLHDQLGSKESPSNTIKEPITLLFEFESGGGSRKLIAASKSRIYALSQRSRNWVIIGDNGGVGYAEGISTDYTTTKFKAAQLGNNIVFTNNYDEPLFWFFDSNPELANKNLAQNIPDLGKLKITKAAHISEYKGFMFLGNLEENSTQQISKVQWSDYIDATSYYPATASLSGQQTVGDFGEAIIGMAVLGDHLIIYKERSIWRCSLVSSANLFVFKQIYQGERTPYYEDTLVTVGDAHFYMAEDGIYRLTISDVRPVLVDWMHNASGIIYNKGEVITKEDDSAGVCTISGATNPDYKTKAACEAANGAWTAIQGGIKDNKVVQTGAAGAVPVCPEDNRPPVITTHPADVSNINANPCDASNYTSTITFTVESTGREPFSYQWQKKKASEGAPASVPISGATEKTFVITNPGISDVRDVSSPQSDYQYRCIVTNEDGTANSNFATTTLASNQTTGDPSILLHPQSQTITEGDELILEARWCTSSTASNWIKDGVNVTANGTTILIESGFLAPVGTVSGYYYSKLTVKNISFAQTGDQYKINIINPAGNTDSTNATITVVKAASEDKDGNITAGSDFSIRTHGSAIRDVLPNETVGISLRLQGKSLVKDANFTGNHQNVRGQKTRTYGGEGSETIADIITHPPFIVQAVGGLPPYKFVWYRTNNTSGIVIDKSAGYAPGDYTSSGIEVKNGSSPSYGIGLPTSLEVGDVIKWSVTPNTATFTVTAAASAGDKIIKGNLVVDNNATLTNEKSSYLYYNSTLEEPISPFTDSTCDTTYHTVTSCVTTASSNTITCSANSSIDVGQYVSGVGVSSDTTVTTKNGSSVTSFTVSDNATAASSPTVELAFASKTVTCDSHSHIAVGQTVSGTGILLGSTVATVSTAGSVTSFTLSDPSISAVTNGDMTFASDSSRYYFVGYSTTEASLKGTNKDTSELSFVVSNIDGVDGTTSIGKNSIFRCVATDAAGVSRISNNFYIMIFSGGL